MKAGKPKYLPTLCIIKQNQCIKSKCIFVIVEEKFLIIYLSNFQEIEIKFYYLLRLNKYYRLLNGNFMDRDIALKEIVILFFTFLM